MITAKRVMFIAADAGHYFFGRIENNNFIIVINRIGRDYANNRNFCVFAFDCGCKFEPNY